MTSQGLSVFRLGLAGGVIGVSAGIFALLRTHAYTSGFSGSDEPAHFLNAYLISTYIESWLGTNPLKFASDFYIHYPKITIGHWPPAYYGMVGLLFWVIPATVQTAFLINLLITALPAAGVAIALGRLSGTRSALIGASVYSFTPLAWEGQVFFMLDQALAACCIAATLAWLWFAAAPGWKRAIIFSLLCAFAVLLKGNGWLLLFMPLYYILLATRYDLLTRPYLYGAALAAAILVVPWYFATAGISADGFNYKAGWSYAVMAFNTNMGSFRSNLGLLSFALVLIAVIVEFRARHLDGVRWGYISACASLILSTLTLQSLVPADIVDRYIAPALPAVLVLAIIGLNHCYQFIKANGHSFAASVVGVTLLVSMFAPGFTHLVERRPKPDYRMAAVAEIQKNYSTPGIWLIDGTSNAEGAFIAEMAIRDKSLSTYVVRASKLFADSNFMGSKYQLRFRTEGELLREIERLGIRNIVIARYSNQSAFPHSEQLLHALEQSTSSFKKIASFAHRENPGITEVYESSTTVVPNFEAVRKDGLPSKASAIVNSLP